VSLVAAQLLLSRTNADAAAWLAYASAAAFINSFNLLPIGALDGGRIVKSLSLSLSPRLGLAVVGGGFLLCAGLLAWSGSYVLAVLLLFSIFELLRWHKGDLLPPMSRKGVAGGLALYLFLFVLFPLVGFVSAVVSNHLLTKRPAAIAELDPTLSALPDVGCSQEGELRSVASTDPTEIMFTNHSTVKLSVYWLNSEGRRSFYAALSPGKSLVQRSYASHPWLIASSPVGTCLAIILASSSPGTVVIRSTAE
jgi:VHL beta domain